MSEFPPFVAGERHVPEYYRPTAPIRPDADPLDIAVAFGLGPELAWALKYVLRAGKKPGASEAHDLTKAMEMIQRRLEHALAAEAAPNVRPLHYRV